METLEILTLENIKLWAYSRRVSKAAMTPLIPTLGESLGLTIEKCYKCLTIDNIERLNQLLEENLKEEETEHKQKKR